MMSQWFKRKYYEKLRRIYNVVKNNFIHKLTLSALRRTRVLIEKKKMMHSALGLFRKNVPPQENTYKRFYVYGVNFKAVSLVFLNILFPNSMTAFPKRF